MNSSDPDFLADNLFENTRMSFGDHIEDLRRHLWRAILGFLLILLLVFAFDFVGYLAGTRFGIGRPMMDFIVQPVVKSLERIYDERTKKALVHTQSAQTNAHSINQFT